MDAGRDPAGGRAGVDRRPIQPIHTAEDLIRSHAALRVGGTTGDGNVAMVIFPPVDVSFRAWNMETELSGLDILFRLLAVLVLVGANGFFVASEFSLVSVRRTRIEELVREGKPLARAVQQALADLDAYLAATQLGITMASIGLGWIGEPALAALLEPLYRLIPGGVPRA